MGADTDTTLLLRWYRQRDAHAFREIAGRYSGMVFATCKRVLGDASEAEDVTQECFLALAQHGGAPPDSLPSWLHVLAVRRSLNRRRADQRRLERERRYAELQHQSTSSDWEAVVGEVDEAIAGLSEDLRAVVVLYFLEQRSQSEIATRLSVSQSTVSRRIDDGIAAVRNALSSKSARITGAALAAALRAHSVEAAPASLSVSLGKLALSASGSTTAFSGLGATAAAIGGVLLMKKLGLIAAAAVIAIGGAWYASNALRPDSTPTPAATLADVPAEPDQVPEDPTPEPAEMAAVSQEPGAPPGTIAGRVYDAFTKQGIEGLEVTAKWDTNGDKHVESAVTDASGFYYLTDLSQDESVTYRVERGSTEGYRPATYMESTSVQLPVGGAVTDLDFAVKPEVVVKGRVVTVDNRPAPGALVRLTGGMDTHISERVTADSTGAFAFHNLPSTSELWLFAAKDDTLVSQPHELNLPEQGISDLLVVLEAACTVSGVVVDPDGNPLPGFEIVTSRRPMSRADTGKDKKADASGRFEVWGLAPGSYEIAAVNPNQKIGGSEQRGMPLELQAGEHRSGVTLVYDRQSRIAGIVRNLAGEPVSGASVTVASPQAGGDYATTDANGAFEVTELLEGSYGVTVTADTYMYAEIYGVTAGTTDLLIELPPPFQVSGTVTDAQTREPIPEFELALTVNWGDGLDAWSEKEFKRISAPDGHFSLSQIQPYRSIIAARAPGYATETQFLDMTGPPYTREVHLQLKAGGDLEGRVVDSRNLPVAQANVFYGKAMHHGDRATATTDEDGRFRLKSFPAEGQLVSAYHDKYAVGSIWVEPNHRRNQPIEIMLPSGGWVFGSVQFADGATPVPCSVYVAYPEDHVVDLNAHVQPDGTYAVEKIAPGEVTVSLQLRPTQRREDAYSISKTATITEGSGTVVNFEVRPFVNALEGVVVYPDGAMPRHVNAFLRVQTREGEVMRFAQPGMDGSFSMAGLPAGSGSLEVDANFLNHRRITTTVSVQVPDGETGYIAVPL